MKAIFLCNDREKINYVFSDAEKKRLSSLVDIDTEKIYTYESLHNEKHLFSDVEYIFSTWGIPCKQVPENFVGEYLPNLKAVFYAAGSVKHFANYYYSHGVRIFSAYAANAIPVAEFTVAEIILANKGFFEAARSYNCCDSRHPASAESNKHNGNYLANVGVIGAGAIGKHVIKLLSQYKLNILVYDKFLSEDDVMALGAKKADICEIFKTCDVISNHLANVPETVGIFKKEHFSSMKPHATFINTGRGAQVNERDMLDVLEERNDIMALLDVTANEPPTNDNRFYSLNNVILTPHIAGSRSRETERMAEYMIDEFERYLKGEKLLYEITPQMLDTMA